MIVCGSSRIEGEDVSRSPIVESDYLPGHLDLVVQQFWCAPQVKNLQECL